MKIAIVGAGIVGVTTAYELASDGHEVTVFEQRSAAAEEASFAPAGLLAPHLLSPWAAPGFGHPLRLTGANATLRLAGGMGRANLAWLWRWRSAARQQNAAAGALERLAQYSLARLKTIATQHELDFEASDGRLILLRSEPERQALQPALQVLRDCGVKALDIDADAARKIEPGLSPEATLAGAIHLPEAWAGNCRLFAQLLRQGTQGSGVHFAFGTRVERIGSSPTGVAVQGEAELRRFDAVVLCAGMASAELLPNLGVPLPMTAVYGYSVSAPLRESTHAPRASVVDLAQQISITRLGQRVRIAGGAELSGSDAAHHAPTLQRLYRTLNDWFPGGAQLSSGLQIWRGARTMLPDGAPIVGASGLPGLWLNTGHGAGGWALACGSARAVADLVAQREPEIPLDGLGMRRF
ncbi:FAD-dependent oxidoreductase [Acidovorax sp. sic0104]|uniref:FAD-dependent oxidoreductase n=1 Tax=Acidovorax sp. sic0104 TaxID=2854784 RepID=UPI001C48FF6E|nr:FAD-dependent oxidoreductase [Acidovorax sp. sic0104]MBV7541715.1 FAD-dependent oxidoreductase [Acidovorax sp. sic0104]